MKTVEIKCDGCGADMTSTGNCVDYRLALVNENRPTRGGFVTAAGRYPALARDHHFCGVGCLDHWRDRERHVDGLWREWNDKWKEENGTKHPNMFGGEGFTWSYPCPPDGLRKSAAAEFEAAALAAFPMSQSPGDGQSQRNDL